MDLDIHFEDGYEINWKYTDCSVILEPNKTYGGLFLGNNVASQDHKFLKENDVQVVIDMAGHKNSYPKEVLEHHKTIAAFDHSSYDLSLHFQECFDYIHEHRTNRRNVLIHCVAGVSRSASIVIGYLMNKFDMDLENAYKFVRIKRTSIIPNRGFMSQLAKLDKELKTAKEEAQKALSKGAC